MSSTILSDDAQKNYIQFIITITTMSKLVYEIKPL